MPIWFKAELDRVEDYSRRLRILHFKSLDSHPLPYIPGQFIKLEMQDPEPFQRSYSIANPSQRMDLNDGLELAFSRVEDGRATQIAFNAKPGLKVNIYGPHGQFILPEQKPERLWLVSTGTGVAPYKSMLFQLKDWLNDGVEIHLVLGARSNEDLLYKALWQECAQTYDNFHCHFCYSQVFPDKPESNDYKGRVQVVLKQQSLQPGKDLFYLCGNPLMVDETWLLLKAAGFSVRQVRREKYVFAAKR